MGAAEVANREMTVWCRHTSDLTDADLGTLSAVLSKDEVLRRDRLRFPRDRRDYTAAHALLRRALSIEGGRRPQEWEFQNAAGGKPAIVSAQAGRPPLVFNLAHTDGLVACVVGRGASAGIDVERVPRNADVLEVAERYFAPAEVRSLHEVAQHDRLARFAELWTLKEAYIKALGGGLQIPLTSFAFQFVGRSGIRFDGPLGGRWHFLLAAPSNDTRLSVAIAYDGVSASEPWPSAIPFRGDDQSDCAVAVLRTSPERLGGIGRESPHD